MAKEKEKEITLIDAFKDFKEEKSIDRPVMLGVLKDVFLTQLAKTYGSADNFDVIINVDKGDCEIYQNFEVVEEVEDPVTQITVEEIAAETGDDDYEIGDTFARKLSLASFGRRGILNIRQNLQGRIMDIEKANVFKKYSERVGEIFTGEVYQTWKNEVLILDEDGNELRMPKSEQIPGERAKVAVESYDDRIDPIGACIGVKGSRIMGIVRELRNENIDVIQWSSNPQLMIQRALNPARISRIDLGQSPEDKIKVFMQADEVKKGIGKGGVNIKLAGMLVGREIEVWRELQKNEEEEDDVLLSEFADVIEPWIIERLQSIGCDTARSVMALAPEDIATRADLEDETVEDVLKILRAEFED